MAPWACNARFRPRDRLLERGMAHPQHSNLVLPSTPKISWHIFDSGIIFSCNGSWQKVKWKDFDRLQQGEWPQRRCLLARPYETLVNRLLAGKTAMFDWIFSKIAGNDACKQKHESTLSPPSSAPPYSPYPNVISAVLEKRELFPAIPTGEGISWLINSYSSRTRRIWADLYNQRGRRPSWLLSAHIRQVREE